jgi:hypothetical protein
MRNESQHPGRSVEFLSRLHDGELDAGERAHFEAHRAHCGECRRAAMEFEESLSLFRSARSRPPNADLAARILRKVQAGPRRPAPFGVLFGIDPRWAAAAATAIFGVLLGYAALERGRGTPPIPVSLVTPSPSDPSRPAPVAAPVSPEDSAPPSNTSLPVPDSRKPRRPSTAPVRVEPVEADRPSASAAEVEAVTVSGEAPLVDSRSADRSGGDDDAAVRPPLPQARRATRMIIEAIDGHGAPPPLLSEGRLEMHVGARRLRYILLVDAQGAVREVSPEGRKEEALEARDAATGGVSMARPANASPAALSELKFKPGNRPRRLLVRFE